MIIYEGVVAPDIPAPMQRRTALPASDGADEKKWTTEQVAVPAGYSSIQFNNSLPPPAYGDVVGSLHLQSEFVQGEIHPMVPAVTEEEARDTLIKYVSTKWCYSSRAARELVFTNITPSTALLYQLETFTEGRQASWAHKPFYSGLFVDGPANGLAPLPWDIVVNPPEMFKDDSCSIIVPHTASVKVCHSCYGVCADTCTQCYGRGKKPCNYYYCGNNGCLMCGGTGRIRCGECDGKGVIPCETCTGRGHLKWYIKLEIKWKNSISHHVIKQTTLHDHLIKNVSGRIAFEAEHLQVVPLTSFDDGVNNASQRLLQQHANQSTEQRILQQRHFVKMVPVSEVAYTYNNDSYTFWVYGDENEVYEEDYPLRRCCGLCTIS